MTDEIGRSPWSPDDNLPQPLVQYSAFVLDDNAGPRHAGYVMVYIDAGPRGHETIVPPAGPEHAYDRPQWARRVEVTVSPAGRSARVWVDGVEIPPERIPAQTPEEAITDGE